MQGILDDPACVRTCRSTAHRAWYSTRARACTHARTHACVHLYVRVHIYELAMRDDRARNSCEPAAAQHCRSLPAQTARSLCAGGRRANVCRASKCSAAENRAVSRGLGAPEGVDGARPGRIQTCRRRELRWGLGIGGGSFISAVRHERARRRDARGGRSVCACVCKGGALPRSTNGSHGRTTGAAAMD